MRIEVLYFDGCPNHERLVAHLRELLDAAGVKDPIVELAIEDEDVAVRSHFLGSPSVRIDGRDIESGADARADFGLKCRLFATPTGLCGVPADEWVRAAIGRAGAGPEPPSSR